MKPIRYQSASGKLFEIPYAAPTDFASTPAMTWGAPLFLIPTGWWAIPAMGHDSAFRNILLVVNSDGSKQIANLTEQESNDLLLEMMCSIKPNPTTFEQLQKHSIYEGVTLGGWHAYKSDRS